jgi:hypothetical protein
MNVPGQESGGVIARALELVYLEQEIIQQSTYIGLPGIKTGRHDIESGRSTMRKKTIETGAKRQVPQFKRWKKGQNIGRKTCRQQIGMEGTETGWTEVQAARTRRKRSDKGSRG